jgi:NTE family protein
VPDLVNLMRTVDYTRFTDSPPLGVLGRGVSLLTRLGLYKGDYLHRWMGEQLASVGVRTFGDLRIDDPGSDLPPEHRYRLVVIVSDITSGRMVRLPWDFHHYGLDPDDQPVADAVRASAAIPFFFRPYRLALPDGNVAICTDGGMLSNYPIHIFDRLAGVPRWPTFGIKLSPRPAETWQPSWARVNGPASLARALVTTMANAHDRLSLDDPAVCARTIFVETNGVKATDFTIGTDVRDRLYERGRDSAETFLGDWDFDKYLSTYRR